MDVRVKRLDLNLEADGDHINKTVDTIATEIGLNRLKQKTTLKLLLGNLYHHRGNKLITPRGKNSFGPSRYNPSGLGHSSLRKVLDALLDHGYIEQYLGIKNLATGEGKMTTIVSTEQLDIKFYRDEWMFNDVKRAKNAEVIILKNDKGNKSKGKEPVDYTDGYRSHQMRQDMHRYINLVSDCSISAESLNGEYWDYDGEPIIRTFIDMDIDESDGVELLGFGGRIYAPWCSIPKYLRKMITIDGEETIELDFPASHINTLYRKVTGSIYDGGDPYSLTVGDTIIPRHIVKILSSIMINVVSIKSVAAAIRKHYKITDAIGDKKRLEAEDFNAVLKRVSVRDIVDAYWDKHHVINFYFLKGKVMGNSIQYMESCIVMNVINELTARRIPVLTVFDSFIVAKQHQDLLEELMFSTMSIAA